jgi:2-polyprenyl-6-methoxyphenol hydroxylase-like FAD-dependent oxidoreductase
MIDFFGSGYDAAERLGLLEALEAVHYPIDSLSFARESGEVRFEIPYPRMRALLGGRHFNFMRGDLERVLYDAAARVANIRFGAAIVALAERGDAIGVALRDGSVEVADLLVGADGFRSTVRALAFGADGFVRDLGYHTAAFVLEEPALRGRLRSTFLTLSAHGKQVSVYPIRHGRVATFWMHRSDAPLDDLSRGVALRELHEVYGSLGGLVPELLHHADAATSIYFDTVSQIEMPDWHRGRVVLVGDACQCVSLLAGQGASMAVGGAYVLAEELARHDDTSVAIEAYERRLRPAIARKQKAGRGVARWFVPESALRMAVRDAVLRASASSLGGWLIRRQIAGESVLEPAPA